MIASLTEQGRKLARRIAFSQMIIVIVVAGLFAIQVNRYSAISAILGGLICILPGLIFAHFAFKYAGASYNQLVVRQFNKGAKLKFLATILLFMMAYQWHNLQVMPLIITYVITLFAQWPIILITSRVKV